MVVRCGWGDRERGARGFMVDARTHADRPDRFAQPRSLSLSPLDFLVSTCYCEAAVRVPRERGVESERATLRTHPESRSKKTWSKNERAWGEQRGTSAGTRLPYTWHVRSPSFRFLFALACGSLTCLFPRLSFLSLPCVCPAVFLGAAVCASVPFSVLLCSVRARTHARADGRDERARDTPRRALALRGSAAGEQRKCYFKCVCVRLRVVCFVCVCASRARLLFALPLICIHDVEGAARECAPNTCGTSASCRVHAENNPQTVSLVLFSARWLCAVSVDLWCASSRPLRLALLFDGVFF